MSYYTDNYGNLDYEEDEWNDRVEMFADPGGNSALRAATKDNPRNLRCPTCNYPNMLTPADVAQGYQCDSCANAQERGMDTDWFEEGDDE